MPDPRKVLVIGSGGREHALAWKLSRSPEVGEVVCTPGSDGIAAVARCRYERLADTQGLRALAREEAPGLVVVGPEAPLAAGLADRLREDGHAVFGPGADGARIESSKAYAKRLMRAHQIPTAEARSFQDADKALAHARECPLPTVVKADGLAAGKGVWVCKEREEAIDAVEQAMVRRAVGDAGSVVVIEDCLSGEEISAFAITDGETIVPLPCSRDHKRIGEGDTGPNTGGMGALCPVPGPDRSDEIIERILVPTVHALRAEGITYRGLLYAGLMWTARGPKVLEFNCRFGDPETQALVALLRGDLFPALREASQGRLESAPPEVHEGSAVCVVLASPGYPQSSRADLPIEGLDASGGVPDALAFHAGTRRGPGGWSTAGGRVLGITARGPDLASACRAAYAAAGGIRFEGMQMRRDIGGTAAAPRATQVARPA